MLAAFLVATAITAAQAVPSFGTALYTFDKGALKPATLPLSVETKGKELTITFDMSLSRIHPTLFRIIPDDCLHGLTINGKEVKNTEIGFCDYGAGRHMDLGAFLRPGVNAIQVRVGDHGGRGGLSIEASPQDPVVISMLIIAMLASVACMFMILRALRISSLAILTAAWMVTVGILLRLAYLIVTPFGTRAHDVDGHIEYVRYFLTYWAVPPAHEGWQFYQPPFYYFVTALWTKVFSLFGVLRDTDWMQWMALASSAFTLLVAVFIAWELFPRKQEDGDKLRFSFLMVAFPALVFFAGRINNDVVVAPLGFLAVLFTLRFLRSTKVREWFLAVACVALGILTKTNVVLLLPAVLISLLLVPNKLLRKRLHLLLLGCLLVFLVCGGFFFARMQAEGRSRAVIVGNIGSLSSGLQLKNIPSSYLTFNPVEIIRRPHNNPWEDLARRQYFPEYFFKSAFSGEFDFGRMARPLVQAVLSAWMLLLPLMAYGMYRSLRKWDAVSIMLCTLFFGVLGGHTAFRFLFPYSSSQDFRYSILLLIPLFFFLLKGRERMLRGLPKDIANAVIIVAGILNLALVTLVIFT